MVFDITAMSSRGLHPTDFQKAVPAALLLKIKMWAF
jgi:hypothetical protein